MCKCRIRDAEPYPVITGSDINLPGGVRAPPFSGFTQDDKTRDPGRRHGHTCLGYAYWSSRPLGGMMAAVMMKTVLEYHVPLAAVFKEIAQTRSVYLTLA